MKNKNINKVNLKKEGAISINYVILIFISSIIILGFLSVTNKTISINEVQGTLDTAGVIALRTGLDETRWRLEEIVVNESLARNKFLDVVYGTIRTGSNSLIRDFKVVELNIYPPNHPGLKRLGIPSGERNQYYIESLATATYRSEPIVDLVAFNAIKYFDFLNSNKQATKMISGRTKDGNVEVIVRSVSRLVLR